MSQAPTPLGCSYSPIREKNMLLYDDIKTNIAAPYTSPDGTVAKSSANGLLGTGFVS